MDTHKKKQLLYRVTWRKFAVNLLQEFVDSFQVETMKDVPQKIKVCRRDVIFKEVPCRMHKNA